MAWYNPATWTPVDNLQGQNDWKANADVKPVAPPVIYVDAPKKQGYTGRVIQVDDPSANSTDQYAQWGGQSAFNNLISGFNTQKQGIFDSATGAINMGKRNLAGGIDQFLNSYKSSQNNINEQAIGNELAKRQGAQGINEMVGRGLKSAGMMLGNKNAGSSSAAQAFAEAYGNIGGREMNKVGNQYEEGRRKVGLAQQELGDQAALYRRDFERQKANSIDSIVSEAQNKLYALDAAMAEASVPDRIAIEQEKNRIKSQASSALNALDKALSGGMNKYKQVSDEARRGEAYKRSVAGYAPTEQFDYSTDLDGAMQDSGPAASTLPIYTNQYTKDQEV